jgi:hypothetical protein
VIKLDSLTVAHWTMGLSMDKQNVTKKFGSLMNRNASSDELIIMINVLQKALTAKLDGWSISINAETSHGYDGDIDVDDIVVIGEREETDKECSDRLKKEQADREAIAFNKERSERAELERLKAKYGA